jgi:predicted RND superfamily exporter protein
MPQTIADFLVRWRVPLLLAALALTTVAAPWSRRLEFNRSIEAMFAPSDPLLGPYRMLKRVFGGDEIALAAYVDPHLFEPAGLERLERLTDELRQVPGVVTVFSLTSSPVVGKAILDSPLRDRFLRLCEGYTLGADHETAGVACLLEPLGEHRTPRTQTIDLLRKTIARHAPDGVLTGEPVLVLDGFRRLDEDAMFLGINSTLLLSAVIIFSFRSVRWVLVPLAVMLATLLWTQALLAATGFRLSMVSSMLWALVTVICVGMVMHVIVSFRGLRQQGLNAEQALRKSLAILIAPIFWSGMTDAAGFGSLMLAHVGPVKEFGVMMALASVVALAAMAMLVPGLALVGRVDNTPRRAWGEGRLDFGLDFVARLVEHRTGLVGVLLAVIVAASLSGIPRLQVETDFTKNFRADSPLVQAYTFVESRLGGAGLLDIIVPVPHGVNDELLARVASLQRRLESDVKVFDEHGDEQPGLTKTMSLADVLELGDTSIAFRAAPTAGKVALLKQTMPLAGSLYGTDPDTKQEYLRIMLRARERQPASEKDRLIRQVHAITAEAFPDAEVTGFFVLLARLIDSVSSDQWLTFAAATTGIALMLMFACGRLSLAIVALAPNALPILMVTGLMGWLGLKINMGAAMIASVSMGLSVDSSIHWLADYQRHRAAGKSVDEAIRAAHQQVGRAMVFSTLALVVGFSALCASQFVPTIYFGALVSLAMLGGLAGNLLLLPLLVKLVTPKDDRPISSKPRSGDTS